MDHSGNLPHRARIRMGEEALNLNVSAMRDRQGNYVAASLAWHVVTRQVRMVARLEAQIGTIAKDMHGLVERIGAAVATLSGASKTAETVTREVAHVTGRRGCRPRRRIPSGRNDRGGRSDAGLRKGGKHRAAVRRHPKTSSR